MAKDIYHNLFKVALEKDGWKITQDPFLLTNKPLDLFIYGNQCFSCN
jgi:hypothetical protein